MHPGSQGHSTNASARVYLRERRTLHVFDGLQLSRQFLAALEGQSSLFVLGQFLQRVAVVPQIHLGADQQEGRLRAVVGNLRDPLGRRRRRIRDMIRTLTASSCR